MCNLRSNISAVLNCHFMYLSCLEEFCILRYEITDPRKNLTQGSIKTESKKKDAFKLLLHTFDYKFF